MVRYKSVKGKEKEKKLNKANNIWDTHSNILLGK